MAGCGNKVNEVDEGERGVKGVRCFMNDKMKDFSDHNFKNSVILKKKHTEP